MPPRVATRARASRISYREDSPEDDDVRDSSFDSDDADPPQAAGAPAVRRHSTRTPQKLKLSLKEPSSDEDFSDAANGRSGVLQDMAVDPPAPKRRRIAVSTRQSTMRTRRRNAPSRPARSQKVERPQSRRTWTAIETDGFCPPWSSLPYDILLSVFTYALAEYPADTKDGSAWLLGAARTCRAFAEPALSALHWSPPIQDARQLQALVDLLTGPSEHHLVNYHSKIKRIELDERILSAKFDLGRLIASTPQLAHVDIRSSKDYRYRGSLISSEKWWKFPNTFAEELGAARPPLKSFHLNEKMLFSELNKSLDHRVLRHALGHAPLSRLSEITFTNFDIECFTPIDYCIFCKTRPREDRLERHPKGPGLEMHPRCLASIILLLPLQKVRYEYSWMGWNHMSEILPNRLQCLELHCCVEVSSEDLQSYLLSHGGGLRKLVLDHNSTLDLEFLQCLKQACPKLEQFTMNLIYHKIDHASRVIQPTYEELINVNTIPTWPSSLVKIELLHLRRWASESAIVFFNSLIDSAGSLPNLRHLALSASIDIGWQHRAGFRDQWVSRFQDVFLRKSAPPPSPHLASLKTFRRWKEGQLEKHMGDSGDKASAKERPSGQGLSIGVGVLRPRRATKDSTLDGPDSMQRSLKDGVLRVLGNKTQGMCNVVDIRIDNSRPMEREYRESDMLDSEESGDEDYV